MRFALPLFLAFSFLLLAALPANAQDGSKPAVAKDGGSTADAAAKEPAVASATKPAAKAPAPLPVVDPDNPSQIFGFIIEAFKTGKWAWGIGLVFMLLTWILSRKILKDKVPKRVLPWLAISLSMGASIAVSFASGMVWYTALSNGLTIGLAAIGGWEALTKLFKKDPPPAPAVAAEDMASAVANS